LIKILTSAISNGDQFFVTGLTAVNENPPGYTFRELTKIIKTSFTDSIGSVDVFYKASSKHSFDFSDTLWFEKQDGKWKLTVRRKK